MNMSLYIKRICISLIIILIFCLVGIFITKMITPVKTTRFNRKFSIEEKYTTFAKSKIYYIKCNEINDKFKLTFNIDKYKYSELKEKDIITVVYDEFEFINGEKSIQTINVFK